MPRIPIDPQPRFNLNSIIGLIGIVSVLGGWIWFAATKSAKIDSTVDAVAAINHKLDGADIYKSAESEKNAAEIADLKARVEMLTNVVLSDRKLAAAAMRLSPGPNMPEEVAAERAKAPPPP